MVRIGIAGVGFMGVTHFKALQQIPEARVVALCTRDPAKLAGDWSRVKGNFGGAGGRVDLAGISCHTELSALLADPQVDVVDICLPTHMHRQVAEQALAAGKHVLVEKPIALTLADADAMLAAAERAGRQLLVAHVLRFFPEFLLLQQTLANGTLGRCLALHLRRVIGRPKWWNAEVLARSGGPGLDLHIHDADFIRFCFGMPAEVRSRGVVDQHGVVEFISTQYMLPGGPAVVTAESGWLGGAGLSFEHGYDAYFEGGALKYSSSSGKPPTLYPAEGAAQTLALPGSDGFVGELAEAVRAVAQGSGPDLLCGQSGRESLRLTLAELASAIAGGTPVKL